MTDFVAGAYFGLTCLVAVFFFRFWRETADRLFAKLAMAFVMLALERLLLVLFEVSREPESFVYLLRLLSFTLILWALIDKNRRGGEASA